MPAAALRGPLLLMTLLVTAACAAAVDPANEVADASSDFLSHKQNHSYSSNSGTGSQITASRRLLLSLRLLQKGKEDKQQQQQQQQQQRASDSQPSAPAAVEQPAAASDPASPSNPPPPSDNPSQPPVTSSPSDNPPNPPAVPESPSSLISGPTPATPAVPEPAPVNPNPPEAAPVVPVRSSSVMPTTASSPSTDPQDGNSASKDASGSSSLVAAGNQTWQGGSQSSQLDGGSNQTFANNSSSDATGSDNSPVLPDLVYVIVALPGITPDVFKSTYQGQVIGVVSQISGVPEDSWNVSMTQQQSQQQQQQLLLSHSPPTASNAGSRRLLKCQSTRAMPYDISNETLARRMLQAGTEQQMLQVILSAQTSNPQLAVYRLSQPSVASEPSGTTASGPSAATMAGNSSSSSFTGCTLELCSRLIAAGVPVDSSSVEVWPKSTSLGSSSSSSIDGSSLGDITSDPSREYQLAYARQLAIIIVASVGGFVLLLVLAMNSSRLLGCCSSRKTKGQFDQSNTPDSRTELPVTLPLSEKVLGDISEKGEKMSTKHSKLIRSGHGKQLNSPGSASTASCSTMADTASCSEIESNSVSGVMSGEGSEAVTPSHTQHRVDRFGPWYTVCGKPGAPAAGAAPGPIDNGLPPCTAATLSGMPGDRPSYHHRTSSQRPGLSNAARTPCCVIA